MRAFVAVLLLSGAARAQAPADSLDAAPRSAPRAELVLGGLAGSYVLAQVGNALGGAISELAEAWATVLAIPAGAALGVIGAGRLRGAEGSAGGAARGAATGALIGYGIVFMAVEATVYRFPFRMNDADLVVLFVSLGAAAVLPSVLAARGYAVTPVRVRAPDGISAPGLTVRVAL